MNNLLVHDRTSFLCFVTSAKLTVQLVFKQVSFIGNNIQPLKIKFLKNQKKLQIAIKLN